MRWMIALLLTASLAAAETFVVAAGVETYDDTNITPLKCAVADARAFADAFRAAGAPEANVSVLTSDATDRLKLPTKLNILKALQRCREKAEGDDTLLFFFAGHGLEKNGQAWLLTFDSLKDELDGTALPMAMVNSILKGFRARNVCFLIDACRNDPDSGRAGADAALTDGLARGMRLRLEPAGATAPTTALLLACDVGQRAYEIPDEQHGAFTYYLLQGLAGKAKAADGTVTLTSLAGYLQTEVVAWAQRNNRQQTPRFDNPGGGDFALLRPTRVQEVPLAATLTVTTIPAGATVSVDGQQVGQTPLTVKLPLAGGQARRARVQVSLTGYLDRAADLDLAPGATANWPAVTLERAPATGGAAPLPSGTLPYTVPDYLHQWAQQLPTNLPRRIRAKDGMPEVLIPAGKFWMGSPAGEKDREDDEGPEKEVTLSAYWIDQHEVTNEQFVKFLQDRQPAPEERQAWCSLDGESNSPGVRADTELDYARGQYRPRGGCECWPVHFVSRHGASAYAEWVGRQLPTEAQWERAARAGTETVYPWGDTWDSKMANGDRMKTIGSCPPNAFGLLDMIGSVWEWCRDIYDSGWYARMPDVDPCSATKDGMCVCRGGSWSHIPRHLRVAFRGKYTPDFRFNLLGFRCAAPAP